MFMSAQDFEVDPSQDFNDGQQQGQGLQQNQQHQQYAFWRLITIDFVRSRSNKNDFGERNRVNFPTQ